MIVTITIGLIICVLFGLFLCVLISGIRDKDEDAIPVSIVLFLVCIFLGVVLFAVLYDNTDLNELEKQKQDVVSCYKSCPCEYHLKQIKAHNSDVNKYNNYWYKFKLEDRSEYLINIDEVLNSEN